MALMVADGIFLDTNVLVYSTRRTSARHAAAQAALAGLTASGVTLWVSRQVLREYLATVTRPQGAAPPLPMQQAVADVRRFGSVFRVVEDTLAVTDRLLLLLLQVPAGGAQIHDANIVATMLTAGLTRLLTFNGSDFSRFAGMITLEPLPTP